MSLSLEVFNKRPPTEAKDGMLERQRSQRQSSRSFKLRVDRRPHLLPVLLTRVYPRATGNGTGWARRHVYHAA